MASKSSTSPAFLFSIVLALSSASMAVEFLSIGMPEINLASHCDPFSGGCTSLSSKIKPCQASRVRVMLSIGGGAGSYYLAFAEDARQVVTYLAGQLPRRQLLI
ncbi:hypothetical protein NL676_010688 [Syzygium grande]|nr:hypothetical protein NL676_010688 [Syzygium grande]